MSTIKTSYMVFGNPGLEDRELPAILCSALGMPLHEFVEATLDKVERSIGRKYGKHFRVKCYRTTEVETGTCLRDLSLVILGFCGDVKDFEVSLAHELLHLLRWDEMMVEAKAIEICKSSRGEA